MWYFALPLCYTNSDVGLCPWSQWFSAAGIQETWSQLTPFTPNECHITWARSKTAQRQRNSLTAMTHAPLLINGGIKVMWSQCLQNVNVVSLPEVVGCHAERTFCKYEKSLDGSCRFVTGSDVYGVEDVRWGGAHGTNIRPTVHMLHARPCQTAVWKSAEHWQQSQVSVWSK